MSAALARKEVYAAPADADYVLTDADFRRIAALLYERSGITLADSKKTLVYSRLAKRIRRLNLSGFGEYCDLVASPAGEGEMSEMLNALTTNLTKFYREPHHFEHLSDQVLKPAAAGLRDGGRLRIWSAGCSTGQEAYTIALTILSAIPDALDLDVRILATDIDSNVVAQGRAGVYADEAAAPIPAALRERWMERDPDGDRWRMKDSVRALVTFNELNLMGAWPMKGTFQAIFCRNVVIYFDEPTQDRLWGRMAPLLAPGGRLYIGHSERMNAPGLNLVSDGLTTYRKTDGVAR